MQSTAGEEEKRAQERKTQRSKRRRSECPPDRVALYSLDHVRAALGVRVATDERDDPEFPRETEHQQRLADIVAQGEAGRWRNLLRPPHRAEAAVTELVARAPHFGELGQIVTMRLRSAIVIGLPIRLPPILLIGAAGIGKSWFLSRLATALGPLPFRRIAMNVATLGDSISGGHPTFRNAQPGTVAKCLLVEQVANPLILVDELDKGHCHHGDPFRPLYSLLDPSDSQTFADEFLGFPLNASHVMFVMAANDPSPVPAPILDRLTVLYVKEPDEAQRMRIAVSIYAAANELHCGFFEEAPSDAIVDRLAALSPRSMRKSLDDAMARASAERRRRLKAEDVVPALSAPARRIGFYR